jgi:hypothetical protein
VKVTFLVSTDAKFRLESLKSRLRREGIDATESGLVELLLPASSLSHSKPSCDTASGDLSPSRAILAAAHRR